MSEAIRPYLEYLAILPPDVEWLGGLYWSESGDAMLFRDGRTFAMTGQMVVFLEGFASQRSLLPFSQMLVLMRLLGFGGDSADSSEHDLPPVLIAQFRKAGYPIRNASAFCGVLCQSLTPSRRIPRGGAQSLVRWLRESPSLSCLRIGLTTAPEVPERDHSAFVKLFLERWDTIAPEVREHWLKHGHAPVEQEAEVIADEVKTKPPTLSESIDERMKQSDRLRDGVPHVDTFVSALSLPPRRLEDPDLPLGGYADITTRGQPDQILPSQFALDGLEFVRRFANHELLYFRKEEPHNPQSEQLVVLLDQGVRTWGVVRLALSAAVLALVRLTERQKKPFAFACTSSPELWFDGESVDRKALLEALEVSDLSPSPSAMVERVLDRECEGVRDIVLLTHRLSLDEPHFAAITKTLPDGVRLFALTVTEQGEVVFAEVRRGWPVERSRFRVDFERREPLKVERPITPSADEWSGDVEPIGYPFRFRLKSAPILMAFEASGLHLLTMSLGGYLHLWDLNPTAQHAVEVLPRPMIRDELMRDVTAIVGLQRGFALCGSHGSRIVVMHYDMLTRRVRSHVDPVTNASGPWEWFAAADLNCVVGRRGNMYVGMDMDTDGIRIGDDSSSHGIASRAHAAVERVKRGELVHPSLAIYSPLANTPSPRSRSLYWDPNKGELSDTDRSGPVLRPMREGRPLLRGAYMLEAQSAGNSLIIRATVAGETESRLYWFMRDRSQLLGDFPVLEVADSGGLDPHEEFLISPNGRALGIVLPNNQLKVVCAPDPTTDVPLETTFETFTPVGRVEIASKVLTLAMREYLFIIRWDTGVLHVDRRTLSEKERKVTESKATSPRYARTYDPERLWEMGNGRIRVYVDCFGQVFLFRPGETEWFCAFFVQGKMIAAVLRDGTLFGPPQLLGRVPTPDAAKKIGQALLHSLEPRESVSV